MSCQRYDRYIQNGIDLTDVAPLPTSWIQNMLDLVPADLRAQVKEPLMEEIKQEYLCSARTAIGTFFYCYL